MKLLMQYWDREKGQAVTVSSDNPMPSGQSNTIDTSDANATAEDIRRGKVVYVNGQRIVGTAEF